MTLAEVEALLGGPAAETVEMPADYPAYRWQRKLRAEVPPWTCAVHRGRQGDVRRGPGAAAARDPRPRAFLVRLGIQGGPARRDAGVASARRGRGKASGPAGPGGSPPGAGPRVARSHQSAPGELPRGPISGPETALPLTLDQRYTRAPQRRPRRRAPS